MELELSPTYRVARALKKAVLGHRQTPTRQRITGVSEGGDVTFSVDRTAEQALGRILDQENLRMAVYSEDQGMETFGLDSPEGILIVDPLDGSRPFLSGIPVSCVSVALTPYTESPTFGEISEACLLEMDADRAYMARKNEKPLLLWEEQSVEPVLNPNENLDDLSWSFEVAGRPMRQVSVVLQDLIDRSSLRGGSFTLSASAFCISRVFLGFMGAFIDVGGRILDVLPELRPQSMGLYPYDVAAAATIAKASGCVVTDAYGRPIDRIVLTDSSKENILSLVVGSNEAIHEKILMYLETRFSLLEIDRDTLVDEGSVPDAR